MDQPYRLLPYSNISLTTLLAAASADNDPNVISQKQQVTYLNEYLAELDAQSIVLESQYIDHDYLEDYAAYYVRCFQNYRRSTSRLHFFSKALDSARFDQLLYGELTPEEQQEIIDSYLGFIVVKPLPKTVIGRTCLKAYPDDDGRRHYPILQQYKVNLFGILLTVDSIAYQEQDEVVAACATSALWSIFQCSGKLFHHPIPSPVEITKSGLLHIPHDSISLPHETRTLNGSGLTPTQMAHAIRTVGMEPVLVGTADDYVVKSTIYAYLRGRIPALLGITLNEIATIDTDEDIYKGKHAVAITGYSMPKDAISTPFKPNGMLITASKIDKFYVHDDQIGPFAKMTFQSDNKLLTSWPDKNGSLGSVIATPDMIILPLYHKIRIPFDLIHEKMATYDTFLEVLRNKKLLPCLSERIVWDIHLTEVSVLKREIHGDSQITQNNKKKMLLLNMPKYLWRATGYEKDRAVMDIIFDATDIQQGAIIITFMFHETAMEALLGAIAPKLSIESQDIELAVFFKKMLNQS